jgi:hypothetical protein
MPDSLLALGFTLPRLGPIPSPDPDPQIPSPDPGFGTPSAIIDTTNVASTKWETKRFLSMEALTKQQLEVEAG